MRRPLLIGQPRKPPCGTPINWGHPLAPMLRICFLFNEGKGTVARNLVRPGLATSGLTINDTTNITWTSGGAGGLCLKSAANAGSTAATFSLAAAIASGSPFTIETRLRPTSLTDNFQTLLTLGGGKGLYLRSTGMLDLYTGSASVIISTVALPTAVWTHVVVTWQNSIARTSLFSMSRCRCSTALRRPGKLPSVFPAPVCSC